LIQRWERDGLLKTRARMMLGKEGFERWRKIKNRKGGIRYDETNRVGCSIYYLF
jgi:hypothetical protein